MSNAAVAVIAYVLDLDYDDGIDFLRNWNEGEFDICRRHWPDAPEECYIGADPLLPQTKAMLEQSEKNAAYAARWAVFRNRDAYNGIDIEVFVDQFREDADAIVDAVIESNQRTQT